MRLFSQFYLVLPAQYYEEGRIVEYRESKISVIIVYFCQVDMACQKTVVFGNDTIFPGPFFLLPPFMKLIILYTQ